MVSILADRRVYRSLMRLQTMGLAVHLEEIDRNRVMVLIDGESIMKYVTKKIGEAVTYPRKRISYDGSNNIIKIEMWREGEGAGIGGEEEAGE